MLPRIDSIRQARTRLRVTQKRLADMSGVSASMINQIESGRSRPSYETARRIFDSLATLEARSSPHVAGDFCSRRIVRVRPTDTLHDAIARMREHSISQVPVFDGRGPVGVVTEDGIMRHLAERGEEGLRRSAVSQAMDPVPPVVGHDTPAAALVPLIRLTKCILVTRDSRIIGIITASDALRMMGD